MEKDFRTVTLDKKRLLELVNKVDSELVTLGIEFTHIEGEKLLWVSNSEFGNKRVVVK